MPFDVSTFDVDMYNKILSRGLSRGVGSRDNTMCIEAAICTVMGLPHGDDPGCVTPSVMSFKVRLNDSRWSSPEARAQGLYQLGLAQLDSLGVVDSVEFAKAISNSTIRVLIPTLFRDVLSGHSNCMAAADICAMKPTADAAYAAA